MRVKTFNCGVLGSKCHIVYIEDGGTCYIIDPGLDGQRFISFIDEHGLRPLAVLLTHHHYDHTGAVGEVTAAFDIPVYIHEDDLRAYGGKAEPFSEGREFGLDGERLIAVSTPGHTKGSVCFYSPENGMIFTGDTLFKDEVGRSDLSDSSRKALVSSIGGKLDRLDDDTKVFPGHTENTDMGYVKRNNPDYLKVMREYR